MSDNKSDETTIFKRAGLFAAVTTPIAIVLTGLLSSISSDAPTVVHIGVGIFGGVIAGPFFGSAFAVGYHHMKEADH